AFHDDGLNGDAVAGDGIFSYSASIPLSTSGGAKVLPVSVSDAQARTAVTSINLTVNAATAPAGTGAAAPSSVAVTGTSVLSVTTSPGSNPTSSGVSVVVDLSSIGGSATQAFADDGLGDDALAGDGVFTYTASIPLGTSPGSKSLPVTIAD